MRSVQRTRVPATRSGTSSAQPTLPQAEGEGVSGELDASAGLDPVVTLSMLGGPNTPPDAFDLSCEVEHDNMLGGQVYFVDADLMDWPWAVLDTNVSDGTLSFFSDGAFSYTPGYQFVGTDSFTFHATDGMDDSNTATVTIDVTNAAPDAADLSASIIHDTQLNGQVHFYDANIMDWPTASVDTGVSNGTLDFNPDGSFIYTPDEHYAGTDSFTYTATDGIDDSNVATVSIEVTNAPPVAADDPNENEYDILHSTATRQSELNIPAPGVLANDTDPDLDQLTVTVNTPPQHALAGGFQLNPDGSFIYIPEIDYVGLDSFTYEVSDGIATDTATVRIEVTNTPPLTVGEAYAAIVNTQLVIPSPRWPGVVGVRDNDSDPDEDDIAVSWHNQPQHGTINVAGDGSFVYDPQTDFVGEDTFEYRISDGFDESEEQLVTIQVVLPVVDLDTDSDNTGIIDHSQLEDDDEMAAPGKILRYNADDDNANDVEDRLESPLANAAGPVDDDDLFPVELAVGIMLPQMEGFTVELSVGGAVDLWQERHKANHGNIVYTIGTDTIPSVLFAEGIDVGVGQVQCILRNDAGVEVNRDTVQFTSVELQIEAYTPLTTSFTQRITADTYEDDTSAGIRRNGDDDNDNGLTDRLEFGNGDEDDLIHTRLTMDDGGAAGTTFQLARSTDSIEVWGQSNKTQPHLVAGTSVDLGPGAGAMDAWVEWESMNPAETTSDLMLSVWDTTHNREAFQVAVNYYAFESIVIVLGGEFQAPADPVAVPGNQGIFDFAIEEYIHGYDVHMYDEDDCGIYGEGAAYDEVVEAINGRAQANVAIMGYSHGGGSTYNLAWRLNENVIGNLTDVTGGFAIPYTAYIDAITDYTMGAENRRPLLSLFHVNQYQNNTGATGGFLNGGPAGGDDDIDRSYRGVVHSNIDDDPVVLDLMRARLRQRVAP